MEQAPDLGIEPASRAGLPAIEVPRAPDEVAEDGEGGTGVEGEVVEVFVEAEEAAGGGEEADPAHGPEGLAGLEEDGGVDDLFAAEGVEDAVAVLFEGSAEAVGDPAALGRGEFADDVEGQTGGDGGEAVEKGLDQVLGPGGEGDENGFGGQAIRLNESGRGREGASGEVVLIKGQGLEAKSGGDGVGEGGEFAATAAEAEGAIDVTGAGGLVAGGPGGLFGGAGGIEGDGAGVVGPEADAEDLGGDVGALELGAPLAEAVAGEGETGGEGGADFGYFGAGEEGFEEVAVGVEAVHGAGAGFAAGEGGVGLEGAFEGAVEVGPPGGVVGGFGEFEPGEGGFELVAGGLAAPAGIAGAGGFAGEVEDRVDVLGVDEIAEHGLAAGGGGVEEGGIGGEAPAAEEGAGDDAIVEEVGGVFGEVAIGGPFEGHGIEGGVPGVAAEEAGGVEGGVEGGGVGGALVEVEEAADGVAGDFGGDAGVFGAVGEVVAGDAAGGFDDTGFEEPAFTRGKEGGDAEGGRGG